MTLQLLHRLSLAVAICAGVTFQASAQPGNRVTVNADQVLGINGRKGFPIGLTMPPPMDGKMPEGKDALQELADTAAQTPGNSSRARDKTGIRTAAPKSSRPALWQW